MFDQGQLLPFHYSLGRKVNMGEKMQPLPGIPKAHLPGGREMECFREFSVHGHTDISAVPYRCRYAVHRWNLIGMIPWHRCTAYRSGWNRRWGCRNRCATCLKPLSACRTATTARNPVSPSVGGHHGRPTTLGARGRLREAMKCGCCLLLKRPWCCRMIVGILRAAWLKKGDASSMPTCWVGRGV